jgi:DNA/RNA endonuclease G (NUC1)
VDGAALVDLARDNIDWALDPRARPFQIGNEAYRNNAWDKGHLVRRRDVCWGPIERARAANEATFHYTNATLQHHNFNGDEWNQLEDWVLDRARDGNRRLCVFTGPILLENDESRQVNPGVSVKVPKAFWKMIVLRDPTADGQDLSAVAFILPQSEDFMQSVAGDPTVPPLELKVYQVPVGDIEQLTELDFRDFRSVDDFSWSRPRPRGVHPRDAWQKINDKADIVLGGELRRGEGFRMLTRLSPIGSDAPAVAARAPLRMAAPEGAVEDHPADLIEDLAYALLPLDQWVAGKPYHPPQPDLLWRRLLAAPPVGDAGPQFETPLTPARLGIGRFIREILLRSEQESALIERWSALASSPLTHSPHADASRWRAERGLSNEPRFGVLESENVLLDSRGEHLSRLRIYGSGLAALAEVVATRRPNHADGTWRTLARELYEDSCAEWPPAAGVESSRFTAQLVHDALRGLFGVAGPAPEPWKSAVLVELGEYRRPGNTYTREDVQKASDALVERLATLAPRMILEPPPAPEVVDHYRNFFGGW